MLTVCTDDGRPARSVYQGQTIVVVCDFEVVERLDAVVGWIEIYDEDGRLVHGRTSAQHRVAHPHEVEAGQRLRLTFSLDFDFDVGEYSVEVGLSSTDRETYAGYRVAARDHAQWPEGEAPHRETWGEHREAVVTEERFQASLHEHLRATAEGTIVVGFDEGGQLRHTGPANPPGACTIETTTPAIATTPGDQIAAGHRNGDAYADDGRTRMPGLHPTIVHVTHAKAGSQWIAQILRDCAPERIEPPRMGSGQVLFWPIRPGAIYPTVYLSRHQFAPVRLPPNSHVLVVVRDLRDTLISGYFSVLSSHRDTDRTLLDLRQVISRMSQEDGLLYMVDGWLSQPAKIQLSWLEAGQTLVKFESLLADDLGMYRALLIDQCGLDITAERLERIVLANRFERYTNGRPRGVEDRENHYRKGIVGDWANYFTPAVTRAFKARYGGLLVATGYERDLEW